MWSVNDELGEAMYNLELGRKMFKLQCVDPEGENSSPPGYFLSLFIPTLTPCTVVVWLAGL